MRLVTFVLSLLIASFQTQLVINTHVTVASIRDDVSKIREEGQDRSVRTVSVHSLRRSRVFTISQVQSRSVALVFRKSSSS